MEDDARWRIHKHSTLEDLRRDVAYIMDARGIRRQGPCSECKKKWHTCGSSHESRQTAEKVCSLTQSNFPVCGKIYCSICANCCYKCKKTYCKCHLAYCELRGCKGYCPDCVFTCTGQYYEVDGSRYRTHRDLKQGTSHGKICPELFKCEAEIYHGGGSIEACKLCPLCYPSKQDGKGKWYCSDHFTKYGDHSESSEESSDR